MTATAIEWTEVAWNPTTGCDRVSAGCDNCYALALAKRLKAMGSVKYQTDGDPRTSGPGFGAAVHHGALAEPLRWRRPRMIFVNSMSDLFHASVPDGFIAQVFGVMARTPQHTYQVLTKRPARMRSLIGGDDGSGHRLLEAATDEDTAAALYEQWPLPNLWLGVSVENQQWADIRIPALLDTPAAVRFLSCEPLLGEVDLYRHLFPSGCPTGCGCRWPEDADVRECGCDGPCCTVNAWPLDPGIHWVIAGGESGPGARPMRPDWARALRDQCVDAGVPFLFKQWGGRTPKAGGRDLDGHTWDQYPGR